MIRAALPFLLLAGIAHADPIAWSAPTPAPGGKGMIALADGSLLVGVTEHANGRTQLRIVASRDFGRTFEPLGIVAEEPSSAADLGDGCLMQSRDGRVWISYRDNHGDVPSYAIRVATSDDGGRTWSPPTLVAESLPPKVTRFSRGLWTSCLFERRDGSVLCFYDDEESPTIAGFAGHQWITAKTWDAKQNAWTMPVTVSRAHDPAHLSRDGMMTVIEPRLGELLCVFESVDVKRPHANVILSVRSDDNGATWSWRTRERDDVFRASTDHLSISPWTLRLPDGRLSCVFCTDADRDRAGVSGAPPHKLSMSVKYLLSDDGGRTWRGPWTIVPSATRTYLPGVVARSAADGTIEIVIGYLDYDADGFRLVRGTLLPR